MFFIVDIIVGIFYRSPNSTLNIFNDSLEKLLNVIQTENKYIYIMVDLNVNTISEFTGTTPQCQQFTNIFLAHYYYHRHKIFPEFSDLRGLSRGNPRSGLIFMGGGGTICIVCSLTVFSILKCY